MKASFRVSLRKPIGAIFSAYHVRKDALDLVSYFSVPPANIGKP